MSEGTTNKKEPLTRRSFTGKVVLLFSNFFKSVKPAAGRFLKTKKGKWFIAIFILGIFYAFCLPKNLFTDPTSTVLLDKNGKLLGAKIADDGQWRFPDRKTVPYKFSQ